jgi:hypothetical protein
MMKICGPAVLLSLMLTACASDFSSAPPPYAPPGPPSQNAVAGEARAVATTVKLIAPFEISGVRQVDHGGPGAYYVCLREANPPPDKRQRYYSIFFDGDAQKGFRLSVIMDECEKQMFSAVPAGPATPLPPGAQQPTGRKKRHGGPQ